MSYWDVVLADSPRGYWRLEDDYTDESGGGYTGTAVGTPSFVAGLIAEAGKAVSFNGSTDGIDLPSLGLDNATGIALEAWVHFPTGFDKTASQVIIRGTRGGKYAQLLWAGSTAQEVRFRLDTSAGTATINDTGHDPEGETHHYVATFDGSNVRLYRDGVQVASAAHSGTVDLDGSGSELWAIGYGVHPTTPALYCEFTIDEVAVYMNANALTAAEVTEHYDAGTNVPPTAAFSASVTDLTVDVDASASSDSDGTIASYEWDFGDGITDTGVTAQHIYDIPGNFTITLTVTDNDGAEDTATQAVAPSIPVIVVGGSGPAVPEGGQAGSLYNHRRGRLFWDELGDLDLWNNAISPWTDSGGLALYSGWYDQAVLILIYNTVTEVYAIVREAVWVPGGDWIFIEYVDPFPYYDGAPPVSYWRALTPKGLDLGRYIIQARMRRTRGLDLHAGISACGATMAAYGTFGNTARVGWGTANDELDPRPVNPISNGLQNNIQSPTETAFWYINGVDADDDTGYGFQAGQLAGITHDFDDLAFDGEDCAVGVVAASDGLWATQFGVYLNGYFEVQGLTPGWKIRISHTYDTGLNRSLTRTADAAGLVRFHLYQSGAFYGAIYSKLEILDASSVVQETILASSDTEGVGFVAGDIWSTHPPLPDSATGLILSLYV